MDRERNLSDLLDIANGSVVAVVGCGGKTSLILMLARQNTDKKVLITPTTKMFPVSDSDVTMCLTVGSSLRHMPQKGISLLGQQSRQSGKLEALPELAFSELISNYDIVLMEADGSRGLPCKGWRNDEPVVPVCSSHTVGVVTTDALGKAAVSDIAYNLSGFLELTGLCEGDVITEQALTDMVCRHDGMFRSGVGQQYLVVNKAEDEKSMFRAMSFLDAVKNRYPGRFKRLIYGSVHKNAWHEV